MTSTLIIVMTTGMDGRDRLSVRRDRIVEPLDMRNFPECTLQVLEMQDGDGITNVYCGIWEPSGFTQRRKGTAKYAKKTEACPTFLP